MPAAAEPALLLSAGFLPSLNSRRRYLVECGGKGSGKSEFAARKLYLRAKREGRHRILILRKIRRDCKKSVVQVMLTLLRDVGEPYEFNRSDLEIRIRANDGSVCHFIFEGLDEKERIKSIKGITAVWVEEATEFTEEEFLEIDLAFREPGPAYHQIILTFNPVEALAPWLKERFFVKGDPRAKCHRSTVEDNPVRSIREEYAKLLDSIKDETIRKIYRLGEWAISRGRVYDWDVVDLPADFNPDEVGYGNDFGYSVNPAAVMRIYRKADEFWVEEVVYEGGLTNQDLGERMRDEGIKPDDPVWCDAAEPKSIEELSRLGFNVFPCEKGPDSVRKGVDLVRSKKVHVVRGSVNIEKEMATYNWRTDSHGNPLPEPNKFFNHAMDAIRYGIVGMIAAATQKTFFAFGQEEVY